MPKTLTETYRIAFDHVSGHCGPARLTHHLTITGGNGQHVVFAGLAQLSEFQRRGVFLPSSYLEH